LKVQCLFAPLIRGTLVGSQPTLCFRHQYLTRARSSLFGHSRHLLLNRFTFPSARHIFILRAHANVRTAMARFQ
jgi:hypothetical protein